MGLAVAMITPWGKTTRCGIRTYSEALIEALVQQDIDVYVVRWPRFGRRSPELIRSCVTEKIPVDRIDLIHHMNEYGLMMPNLERGFYVGLKNLGKPVVVTMHAIGDPFKDAIVASVSDRIIVHNAFCARRFQGDKKKVVVIPHGCSPQSTPPMDECKRALGIDPRAPIVGYQGFISPTKGVEMLIEAMTKVPNAALLVGGGWFVGEETDYIIRLKQWSFQVLPGRCQWLNYVPDEQLAQAYGAMDILVYPSRFATESGALLNALSHGRAVIASNLPPFKEKEKQGALITFKNVNDLRRKIKRLLKNEEQRARLSEGARKYAESVAWPRIAQMHRSLYEDIVQQYGKD